MYLPEKVVTNQDLEKIVDTNDEWIVTRTGIRERRIAAPSEATSDFVIGASKLAMEEAGITAEDIDTILVGTVTPDMRLPSAGCLVQDKLGAKNAAAMDIVAACSGFIYGLKLAQALVETGNAKNVLVAGSEKLSSITNWKDRSTCVLFGDGAGVAIVGSESEGHEILATEIMSDGSAYEVLYIPGGGSKTPLDHKVIDESLHLVHMEGKELFKVAVRMMEDISQKVLKKVGLEVSDITWLVPHQANIRIINSLGRRMELPEDRVIINIEKYGNVSSASIPIALSECKDRFKKGDIVLLVAFGGGLTWGATVLRW